MAALPADALPQKTGSPLDLLDGVVVIDLTTSIAGPYAGQLLADLGAKVIKIEKPVAGDDCRSWGPPFLDGESLWFLSVNRNKLSVTLDFASALGCQTLRKMIERADVVLLNLVDRAQQKLGIDYASLSAVKKDIIHVSITGFGLRGRRADMPCYDLIAEGYSGVMDMTGEADAQPQKVGTPAADLLAGEDAAMAAHGGDHSAAAHTPGLPDRHFHDREHDALYEPAFVAVLRFGRSDAAFGGAGQRHRHLSEL